MGKIKSFFAYTNPFLLFGAIPVLSGIIVSAMIDGVFKKTTKVVTELKKDFESDDY
jgi:hypothetical protein